MAGRGSTARRGLGLAIGASALAAALYRLLPAETGVPEREFCLAVVLALALLLAAISGRPGFGLFSAGALAGAVWLAGALKLAHLHTPLLAPDLRYFTGASTLEVVAHYPRIWRKAAMALVGGLALGALVWRLESPGWWHRRGWRMRGTTLGLALAPLLLVAWPDGPFGQVHAVSAWDFLSQGEQNPTTTFLRSLTRMRVRLPDYAPDAAGAFDWTAAAPQDGGQRPDLVAVLEESTLDPRQWAVCDVPRCAFPLFQRDERTHAYGLLKVHTYGGATWTSEFAFLTGLPHTLFGPAGLYAPYNLAPQVRYSLPRRLKALGYRTVAIYSMPRGFVRAGDAYAEYGFDEFVDAQDLGLVWGSTDEELMQGFARVLARVRTEDDRPLFFMIVTMRQHGPHDYPLDPLPPPWNEPPLPGRDARLNRNLGQYLFRLHQSSEAIASLRRMLFAGPRPAVLLHFGDHRPSFDGLERTLPSALPPDLQADAPALTYFRIDGSGTRAAFDVERPLDIAFLGGLLLDVAELPRDAYFEANARLRERCGGRFEDCPDRRLLDSYLAHVFGTLRMFGN